MFVKELRSDKRGQLRGLKIRPTVCHNVAYEMHNGNQLTAAIHLNFTAPRFPVPFFLHNNYHGPIDGIKTKNRTRLPTLRSPRERGTIRACLGWVAVGERASPAKTGRMEMERGEKEGQRHQPRRLQRSVVAEHHHRQGSAELAPRGRVAGTSRADGGPPSRPSSARCKPGARVPPLRRARPSGVAPPIVQRREDGEREEVDATTVSSATWRLWDSGAAAARVSPETTGAGTTSLRIVEALLSVTKAGVFEGLGVRRVRGRTCLSGEEKASAGPGVAAVAETAVVLIAY